MAVETAITWAAFNARHSDRWHGGSVETASSITALLAVGGMSALPGSGLMEATIGARGTDLSHGNNIWLSN